jgi:glycosyltransferase involved in cell wall biosynthesis
MTPASPSRPPSLLIVTTVAHTIDHFLLPYADHFREQGWRVDAAANGALTDAALVGRFDHLYELPLSRSILDVGGLVRGMRAMSTVLESAPDIVHVHTPIAAFITRAAVRRLPAERRPLVAYTAHGFHFHQGGSPLTNAVFLTAERIAGRWTDRLVVINDEDYEAAQRHRIVPFRKLVRMPGIGVDSARYARSAVPPAEIAAARAATGAGPDDPLYVAVGELSVRKRMADVISALARSRHQEAHLAIAGEGAERAHLEALIAELGLTGRVQLAGSLKDVRPLVSAGNALILASSREGLPRSIMEGSLLEQPVLASTARGNGELVSPETGILFETGDIAALAAAMDRIADDPAAAREMGRLGRERMIERYELSKLIARHEQMYAEMLGERPPAG